LTNQSCNIDELKEELESNFGNTSFMFRDDDELVEHLNNDSFIKCDANGLYSLTRKV